MSDNTTVVASHAFPVASIITIIFVIAKLFGVVSWSWWLVFLPLIISFGIGLIVVLLAIAVVVAGVILTDK